MYSHLKFDWSSEWSSWGGYFFGLKVISLHYCSTQLSRHFLWRLLLMGQLKQNNCSSAAAHPRGRLGTTDYLGLKRMNSIFFSPRSILLPLYTHTIYHSRLIYFICKRFGKCVKRIFSLVENLRTSNLNPIYTRQDVVRKWTRSDFLCEQENQIFAFRRKARKRSIFLFLLFLFLFLG